MFITFEGIEGAGKSLQIERTRRHLEAKGVPCRVTREPGGTEFGTSLRAVLLAPGVGRLEPVCELLLYLARNAGKLVTRGQLLQEVWGYQADSDATRTVDYHIRALRKKLGDDAHNPTYIETVYGSGYRMILEEKA